MQSLEIISINIWHILISLCNLVILFLILKKFLYKPVERAIADRKSAIEKTLCEADDAKRSALQSKSEWDARMKSAESESEEIKAAARRSAEKKSEQILCDARQKADEIMRRSLEQAELDKKKSEEDMKQQIVILSSALAEKMLAREINEADHRELIDEFIVSVGEIS